MNTAARAELLHFQAVLVVAPALLRSVVALVALRTLQGNYNSHTFFSSHIYVLTSGPWLVQDLGDDTGADGQTAFTNGELRALLQSHRRAQFHFQVDVVSRHDHLHAR